MGKGDRIIDIIRRGLKRKHVGPPPPGATLAVVGNPGPLAVKSAQALPWLRRASKTPSFVRRTVPWIVGGSVAWEFGRQVWEGMENGRLVNDEGKQLGSLADGCATLRDIFSDVSQIKTLVSDLHNVKKSGGSAEASLWLERMKTNYYGLTEEGQILVYAYQARRESSGSDFVFNSRGCIGTTFLDVYLSWYQPSSNAIEIPSETAVDDLFSTLTEFYSDMMEQSDIVDGGKQLVDLDTWLKYNEMVSRVKYMGSIVDSDPGPVIADGTEPGYDLY